MRTEDSLRSENEETASVSKGFVKNFQCLKFSAVEIHLEHLHCEELGEIQEKYREKKSPMIPLLHL